ncbi:MAG: hypothetical protein GX907_05975 [Clostridiaceae bacterium]|nr:hypothetical protein [Clostridiaceae bacterium]
MKLKKLTILLLILVLGVALPLSGCSVGGGGETGKAKATVDSFIKALRELDHKSMVNLVAKGVDMGDEKGFDPNSKETQLLKEALKRMKCTYKSGEVAKDAKEVTFKYEVEAINAMLIGLAALGGNQKVSDMPLTKSEVEVKLVQEGDSWKILNPQDVAVAATGMGDLVD